MEEKGGMKLGNCWCEASVCRATGVKIAKMCNLCCYTVGVEGQRRSRLVPLLSLLPPKLHAATAGGKMASQEQIELEVWKEQREMERKEIEEVSHMQRGRGEKPQTPVGEGSLESRWDCRAWTAPKEMIGTTSGTHPSLQTEEVGRVFCNMSFVT